jgi:peptidoglycan/LPS O-acetylase OafA/YrhL
MSLQIYSDESGSFPRRIPELDGIRGIAILLVLVWHYAQSVQPFSLPDGQLLAELPSGSFASYVQGILGLTWSGVDLFFVLSGFLIGGILLQNKEASNYFKVFYVRRACRIFPLYFLWFFIFLVLVYGFPSLTTPEHINWLFENPLPLWSYATFTQNIAMAQSASFGSTWLSITWSLAVEEQFYLILPFIIYFVSRRRLPYLLVCAILAAPALRFALFFIHPYPRLSAYVLMPCRADALLLGVLCAYLVHQPHTAQYIARHLRALYSLFIILLLAVLGMSVAVVHSKFIGPFALQPFAYSLLALLYSCFLLVVITEKRGILSTITNNLWLRRLGMISYGVYVYHVAFIGLMQAVFLKQKPQINGWVDVLVTGIAFLLMLVLSYLSWKFFEKPIVAIGHSFKYRNDPPIKVIHPVTV